MAIAVVILIILAACAVFLWAENNLLQVSRHTLHLLPQDEVRIVHLSDLHDKTFGKQNRKLLSKVKELNPDLICYTGDLNCRQRPGHYRNGVFLLQALAQIAPTLYAFGNHEVAGEEREAIRTALANSGVMLLQNETVKLKIRGAELQILGLDIADRKPAFARLQIEQFTADPNGCRILLCHYPQYFSDHDQLQISDYPVDLVLAGHAHGGQIQLFGQGIFAPEQGLFPKFTAGLYQKNSSAMIVSRGLGGSFFQFRFFNRPEIVVIDLKKKENF